MPSTPHLYIAIQDKIDQLDEEIALTNYVVWLPILNASGRLGLYRNFTKSTAAQWTIRFYITRRIQE
jgi:hypothetical protein